MRPPCSDASFGTVALLDLDIELERPARHPTLTSHRSGGLLDLVHAVPSTPRPLT